MRITMETVLLIANIAILVANYVALMTKIILSVLDDDTERGEDDDD